MDDLKLAKIKQFLRDESMAFSIKEAMKDAFLKPSKDRSIENLAARFIAVELLEEAWKDLKRFQDEEESKANKSPQIGL